MKTLTNLAATLTETNYTEPHGVRAAVLHEPVEGWFVQVRLGSSGVTVDHGPWKVAIPLAEIIALAELHEPGLKPEISETSPGGASVPASLVDQSPASA